MEVVYDFRVLTYIELSNHVITVTPPLAGGGNLSSNSIALSINQATAGTDGYLTSSDYSTFAAKMSNPMTQFGDLIIGDTDGVPKRLGIGAVNTVLHGGGSPSWDVINESHLSLSNNTTGNSDVSRHGFLPKLSGSNTQYLDGEGNWTTPTTTITIATLPRDVKTVSTSDYTINTTTDDLIQITVSGVLTLHPADGHQGKMLTIDNAHTNAITVMPSGIQTIQGEAYQTIPSNSSITVYSDGSKWRII